ncbi:MAG: DUF1566 domain-containing protein [Campylobacterales bacterium]|nr:DUF1566 domain-containing protein [Campylobacterales bacterium]
MRSYHHSVYSQIVDVWYFCYNCTTFIVKAKVYDLITSNNYWSSTTNANNTSNAWNVNFNNGNTNNNNKTNSKYVRCVRGGE